MAVTSLSLLDRLRQAPSDADWRRFHDLYRGLIAGWLARVPGLGSEADDLAQEVLLIVCREVATFDRQRQGSFRTWLWRVMVNRVRQYWRDRAKWPRVGLDGPGVEDFLARLEDPADDLTAQWDREHDRHVVDRLLGAVRGDFQPATWEAFRRFGIDGLPAARVAADLGMTENAVLLAKARVLQRLRDEAGGLLD